ncbi:MAG: HAMP domain-containing protein [Acidobacteria bacterium]|nr:MAG: HAMP domain-containing protein [Acidobacteriota bacterium]
MKISTKIILGYALLILLMVTALIYQLALMHRLQTINGNLSAMKTRETDYSLRARDITQVIEDVQKFYLLKDPDYASQVKYQMDSLSADLSQDLERLKGDILSRDERTELQRFVSLWGDFKRSALEQEANFSVLTEEEFYRWLGGHTKNLEAQLQRVQKANQEAVNAQVEQSGKAGQKAEFVSKVAAGIAVVLSFVISIVVVRSIALSLRRLTSGARAVAEGEYSYRLDASGNDNFSQVARDFNFMVSKLDEREQVKRDYVSHVSHELKAPLAAMQETARLLMEGIPGPVNERQKRLLGLTLECGQRLSRTLVSLLDLSRIESDALDYEIERTDLREVIQSASREFEVQLAKNGRNLELDLPSESVYADCDGDRIAQIISNLIDNALKFSTAPAPIAIKAEVISGIPDGIPGVWRHRLGPANRDYILVKVSDRGRGVPDEHKELIFEKFHQVKFEKKIAGQGVGLGLVICKNIVTAHGGAIWVSDNLGGGSIFYILLPAAKPLPVSPPEQRRAAKDVQPAQT